MIIFLDSSFFLTLTDILIFSGFLAKTYSELCELTFCADINPTTAGSVREVWHLKVS